MVPLVDETVVLGPRIFHGDAGLALCIEVLEDSVPFGTNEDLASYLEPGMLIKSRRQHVGAVTTAAADDESHLYAVSE